MPSDSREKYFICRNENQNLKCPSNVPKMENRSCLPWNNNQFRETEYLKDKVSVNVWFDKRRKMDVRSVEPYSTGSNVDNNNSPEIIQPMGRVKSKSSPSSILILNTDYVMNKQPNKEELECKQKLRIEIQTKPSAILARVQAPKSSQQTSSKTRKVYLVNHPPSATSSETSSDGSGSKMKRMISGFDEAHMDEGLTPRRLNFENEHYLKTIFSDFKFVEYDTGSASSSASASPVSCNGKMTFGHIGPISNMETYPSSSYCIVQGMSIWSPVATSKYAQRRKSMESDAWKVPNATALPRESRC